MMTWNMQGGQGAGESKWANLGGLLRNPAFYKLDSSLDVVMLQECSDVPGLDQPPGWGWAALPPGVEAGSKNFGTHRNPLCYFLARFPWAGTRVSFAILIATPPVLDPFLGAVSQDLTADVRLVAPGGVRPLLGVQGAAAGYYSMHAPSGVSSGFSRAYVNHMIGAVVGAGSYVIGGDFNCEPGDLYPPANPIPHGQLFPAPGPTFNFMNNPNRVYDYFVGDNNAGNGTALGGLQRLGLVSDHISVGANH